MENSEGLKSNYQSVRTLTLELCNPLQTEDFVAQPVVDVSPPKWHLGHTTWFFENFVLCDFKEKYRIYNKEFNYIFNSYYESKGERINRAHRGNLTRPSVEEVKSYRKYVDDHILEMLSKGSVAKSVLELVELGLHHEQQHQELLVTDLKYILGHNPLFPKYHTEDPHAQLFAHATVKHDYIEIEGGVYEIGHDDDSFCFDNEKGRHKVYLHSYRILDRLITNREYLEFIDAGGYENFEYWLSEGWDWVCQNKIEAPLYWFKKYDEWVYFTLHGLRTIDLEAPVTHVSYYEAEAFARWKGKRLPSEYEWEVASNKSKLPPKTSSNLLDSKFFTPISRQQGNDQMIGDVWEWTGSAYLPYPFYQQADGALGEYNGKFMVNQMVLRGGSCATPKSHIRNTYRNFFQTDKRWQFTGFRLAENI